MSVILNIDTSMGTAGVCLSKEGIVLALAESQDQKNHSSWLHRRSGELLAEAGYRPGELAGGSGYGGSGFLYGAERWNGCC